MQRVLCSIRYYYNIINANTSTTTSFNALLAQYEVSATGTDSEFIVDTLLVNITMGPDGDQLLTSTPGLYYMYIALPNIQIKHSLLSRGLSSTYASFIWHYSPHLTVCVCASFYPLVTS